MIIRLIGLCDRILGLFGLCTIVTREVVATGSQDGWLTCKGGRRSVRIGRLVSHYTTTAGQLAERFGSMNPDKVIAYRIGRDVRMDRASFL